MRLRPLVLVIAGLALAQAAFSRPPGPQRLTIDSPSGVVTDFSFEVSVRIPVGATFDPDQDVTLNGSPIPVSGGPETYTATVDPGFPLLDRNRLLVTVVRPDGRQRATQRRFLYRPPKARAFEIRHPKDLIAGPLAHGRVGDYMLENSEVRVVVQGVPRRDLHSVGAFGGNIIDAELLSDPGRDNFLEIQPMLNVETVINADELEIVNDGQDGTAAIIRTCGPDDLIDYVNPSSFLVDAGVPVPEGIDDNDQDVEGCTEYRLEPLVPYVEMATKVTNVGSESLALAVGDWVNAAGQIESWARPFQLGEALLGRFELLSFIGYDEAEGVDYGYATVPVDPPLADALPSEFFTTSGVTVVLHNTSVVGTLFGATPPFVVPAGGDRTFTRYLSVGDGSGSNGVEMGAAVNGLSVGRLEGCVTVAGVPKSGSRVSVVTRDAEGKVRRLESQFVTEPGPCPNYSGDLPAGTYEAAAARDGALYQGGAETPPFTPVAIPTGGTLAGVDFDLPAPGGLQVTVVDGDGRPLPARVTVVGFDPSPPLLSPGPGFFTLGGSTVGLFNDPKDSLPFGIVALDYADHKGEVEFDVEPGSYQVFVSRGSEYSLFQTPVSISTGATTAVAAQIVHVLDTAGFISSDFHVHGIHSPDSRVPHRRRVLQFAGEGVENVIMTDHDAHTDLGPTIAALNMQRFLTSTIGEEITSFDYGHFNGYPFTIDPSLPSGGSTDWARAAPVGEDFPSLGAFNATPAEIYALAVAGPRATPDTMAQVNHIDSHFAPLQIDTSVPGTIADDLDEDERLARRLDPGAGNLFYAFPALELWNGSTRGAQSEFLDQRIGIWFNHLNKGLPTTIISDTDTHSYANLRTAGARTWTASSTDSPAWVSSGEVARSTYAGRAVGGQGIFVTTRLLARDGSGEVADLTNAPGATTSIASSNGAVDLEIRVQAPTWAPFDTIEVYANAPTEPVDPEAPYLFRVAPDDEAIVLSEGDCDPSTKLDGDFDITVQPVNGSARQEVTVTVSFTGLSEDTWFVALAKGSDGVCEPMFPIYPSSLATASNADLADLLDGNLGEDGVMALGVTNPLYADLNGVAGWQAKNP